MMFPSNFTSPMHRLMKTRRLLKIAFLFIVIAIIMLARSSSDLMKYFSPSTSYFTVSSHSLQKTLNGIYISSRRRNTKLTGISLGRQSNYTICMVFSDRLGNRLFQYASFMGIAARTGLRPIVSGGHELRGIFNISADEAPKKGCPQTSRIFTVLKCCMYEPNSRKLNNSTPLIIRGYLQSWKYFMKYRNIIKKEYTFKSNISKMADVILHKISGNVGMNTTRQKHIFVAIHIRRGDMITQFKNVWKGYTVADELYIKKAVEYFLKEFQNYFISFVVCSNDMHWSKKTIMVLYNNTSNRTDKEVDIKPIHGSARERILTIKPINGSVRSQVHKAKPINDSVRSEVHKVEPVSDSVREQIFTIKSLPGSSRKHNIRITTYSPGLSHTFAFVENSPMEVDLAVLSRCNHTIMTVGTFGWWAAWLASGQVVYYANFPRPNSPLATEFSKSKADYFPPNWVGL